MPAPAFAPAPRPRTRVLMAVHSAERGGAQLVALGQARALRRECDLVIAVGAGPLRGAFAEVATAIVRGPTSLPIWGASYGRWALQIGRSIPDAVRLARLVRRHRIDVVIVNSTVLVAPVIGARLAGVPVIVHAQEAPKSVAARRLFRVHGALAHTVVAISPWIARAFDGARASVVLNPVGIHIPGDPGPARVVRRRSGPARADRHRGSPQAPGRRDRRRPGAARARGRGRADASRDRGRRRLRGRASGSGARPRCGAAGPLRGADLRRRRPTAGRGRTAAPGGRGDAARPHGGDGAQDPGRRGAHGQHPRCRHRRGERPAGRAGRPGRACRGGRSPSPGAGPCGQARRSGAPPCGAGLRRDAGAPPAGRRDRAAHRRPNRPARMRAVDGGSA